MIDRHLLPWVKTGLAPLAGRLVKSGITANQISLAGFAIGALALPLLAFEHYGLALMAILANRIFDGLDGLIARATKPTDQGAFLDITLDFIFYALVPLGFAFAAPQNALPAAILITSFIGTGSSFLAFALIAQKRKLESTAYPQKGIYYLGGLTEGFETIAFFVLICLFPAFFPPLALLFAIACSFTAALRIYYGYTTFKEKESS